MKWKYIEIDRSPELSPDLEWMLQSGQVSRQLLLEKLADAYYPSVFRLAISLTGDSTAARIIVQDVFSSLVLDHHRYRSQVKVDIWVHQTAYRITQRTLRRESFWRGLEWWIASPGQFTNPLFVVPKDELDRSLWRKLDQLDEKLRTSLLLRYGNGWEIPYISLLTGVGEDEIDKRIHDGLEELADQTALPEEGLAAKLSDALQSRYKAADPEEVQQFVRGMESKTRHRITLRGGLAIARELMLVALAILLVLLVLWGGNRYIFGGELLSSPAGKQDGRIQIERGGPASVQQSKTVTSTPVQGSLLEKTAVPSGLPTSTPTPEGVFYIAEQGDTLASIASKLGISEDELRWFNRLPDDADVDTGQRLVIPGSVPTSRSPQVTPVVSVSPSNKLLAPRTSDDVFNIISPEVFRFNTIWFSAEIITHEPQNPASASKISQIQVWLSPRQFLLIGGQSGDEPMEVSIGLRGRLYVARPGYDQPWFQRVYSRFSDPFIDPALLYGLYILFGEIGDLTASEFVVLGDSMAAGRDAWVVSQLNPDGDRLGLLYLDKGTGFILQYSSLTEPKFIAEAGSYLPDKVVVKAIAYDVDFPQELFNLSLPWRGGYAADHTGQPISSDGPFFEEPAASLKLADRAAEPPADYDPSKGRLEFRFPIGRYTLLSMAGTDIYADGYYVGSVDMGVPWNITCQRSNDGQVIVYQTATSDKDDIVSLSNSPYYVRLIKPLEIRRVLPGASRTSSDFAVSPDSRYVALWACERNDEPCGVYLYDLKNHNSRRLVDIPGGAWGFVWSPGSDQLAMLTAEDYVLVVNLDDGELLFTTEYDGINQVPSSETPMDGWGAEFPSRAHGLEACINSP